MTSVNQQRPAAHPFLPPLRFPHRRLFGLHAILPWILILVLASGCSFKPKGGIVESTETYQVVLDDSSTDAGLFNNRGTIKMQNGEFEGAMDDFREAVKRNPNEASYLENLAWAQAGALNLSILPP